MVQSAPQGLPGKPTQQTDLRVREEEVLRPQVILCASWHLITDVSFLLQGGADETWCQARGLSWEALCQARKLRAELLELMQRIELPLSLPAFGSEQNRRDLQKALLSGYFLKVGEEWLSGVARGAWCDGAHH